MAGTSTIAQLQAVIGADISNFMGGLRTVSSELKDMGGKLTAGLTLPIVAFGTAALKSFSDSQTALTQLNAVLKSTKGIAGVTAKQAIDLSKALQKVTRYSDEDVLSAENLLLTFTNIGKDVFPDTTKIALDMSTALGQDLKSSAIQLGKALQDPITGVTALRRVGVNFTKAQMDQIKAMVKAGNLMGAQKLILKELKTEFGGSAEAAGKTFAGSLDKLKNKFDDFLEVIGGKLAPFLEKAIDFLSQLIDKISGLDPHIIEMALGIAAAVAAAGPLLSIFGALVGVVGFLLSPIGLLVAAVAALGVAFATNFLGIRDFLAPALTAIGNFIGDIGKVIQVGIARFQEGGVGGLLKWLFLTDEDGSSLLGWLGDIIGKLVDSIVSTYGPMVVKAFTGIWTQVGNWVSNSAWPAVQSAFTSFFQSIADWFNNGGLNELVQGFTNLLSGIANWIQKDGLATLQSGLNQLMQGLSNFFSSQGTIDLVKGIGDAFIAMVNWIINVGLPLITSAFETIVMNILQILGKIAQGIVNSVTDGINRAVSAAKNAVSGGGGPQVGGQPVVSGFLHNLPFGIGSVLQGAGFAGGGYTGEGTGVAGLVHGQEYVVPKGGALVSGGGGPQTIHLIADFGDAVQHIYFNVGEAINRGNAMPLRRMG